jgi:hypothetical protein
MGKLNDAGYGDDYTHLIELAITRLMGTGAAEHGDKLFSLSDTALEEAAQEELADFLVYRAEIAARQNGGLLV